MCYCYNRHADINPVCIYSSIFLFISVCIITLVSQLLSWRILSRGILSGGLLSGGFCPWDIVRGYCRLRGNIDKDVMLQRTARLRRAVSISAVSISAVLSHARFRAIRGLDARCFVCAILMLVALCARFFTGYLLFISWTDNIIWKSI